MSAKGMKDAAVKLVSEVVKGKFSAAKIAPLGTEGVKRIINILETFKGEVLDTDADLLASLAGCHDHLVAKVLRIQSSLRKSIIMICQVFG